MESNQKKPLTSNILPATVTNDKSLTAIFSFKFEELTSTFLFSRATHEKKPITTMYMDAKVNGHSIKLILDNSQNGHHTCVPATCGHFKTTTNDKPLIKLEEKKNLPEKCTKFLGLTLNTMSYHQYFSGMTKRKKKEENAPEKNVATEKITKLITTTSHAIENAMVTQRNRESRTMNYVLLVYTILISNWVNCGTSITAAWH
ncbi:hypothetical protein G9A89_014427 [Geosiphon pyriformis]|nr:hypothetical protein G9A89_014427 [Geosiphon pyriformis]